MPGVLTREISLLSQLRSLVLEEGKLNYLPGNILEVPKLQNLDLDKNRIRGEFQSGNTTNSEMLRLDINYNSFSGSLDFLSNMPNLKEAHLDNNKFDGTIPEVIGTLSNLGESQLLCFGFVDRLQNSSLLCPSSLIIISFFS